jgi:predicted nucleic acid-binding Zn ribbon protein
MGGLDRARIWQYIKETSNISPNRCRMTTRSLRQRRNYIPMVLFYLVVAILAMS